MDNSFTEIRQNLFESTDIQKEINWLIEQNRKQLDKLSDKLGSFAEGLDYPMVKRVLLEYFQMERVGSIKIRKAEDWLEINVFGYSNAPAETVIAGGIESYFRKHHIDYIEEICQKLPNFMPEHASKKIYGIAIFAQGDQNAIDLATQRGIYTVQANYDTYTLRSPKHFVPRDFGQAY